MVRVADKMQDLHMLTNEIHFFHVYEVRNPNPMYCCPRGFLTLILILTLTLTLTAPGTAFPVLVGRPGLFFATKI